jgi:hypothetical protein
MKTLTDIESSILKVLALGVSEATSKELLSKLEGKAQQIGNVICGGKNDDALIEEIASVYKKCVTHKMFN